MQGSQLKFYSVGTVAKNKALDSRIVEISPMEDQPMQDGEITDNGVLYQATGTDHTGAAYSVDAPVGTTVSAEWLPIGSSNRITAPDVRRGETVMLWKYADQDKFFWTTLRDDSNLRKLETVVYAFSGTQDEAKATDASSSYFFEVSTHKKTVSLHTSNANGEPFIYDVQIDAGNGNILIQDDIGNSFTLESAANKLTLTNSVGSFITVDQNRIELNAVEVIEFNASQSITSTAPAIVHESTVTTNNGNWVLNGDMVTAPGKNGATGKGHLQGSFELDGSMTAHEDLIADRTVKANQIISETDIIAPNV